ncbi:MAG: four helix bundle protein [Cyclobacteriaceae bacterium]
MIQSLEEFKTYQRAMEVAEKVYDVAATWNYFEKDTIGKQLVRAVDSVAANLSEGLGRYHYKERKNFSCYSRGSLFETKTWIVKAGNRKMMDEKAARELLAELEVIGKMINSYINSLGENNNIVNEPEEEYTPTPNAPIPNAPIPNP